MFRWKIRKFSGEISISSLIYTFHHALASNNLEISSCRMSDDPVGITDAENFYEHNCWYHPTNYTSVQATENTVYDVNVIDHKYGLEWRISQGDTTFFAIGHMLRYEDTSNYSDICLSQGSDGRYGGKLYKTYTYSRKKITSIFLPLIVAPNPFNPTANLKFTLHSPIQVKLEVYSVAGQKVATLVDGPMNAGSHSITFDG